MRESYGKMLNSKVSYTKERKGTDILRKERTGKER